MGEFLLGGALPLLLFAVGLLYAVALRGFPLLHPVRTLRELTRCGRSSLRALSVALGGTLGVGNIAGVALALSAGGAGALFWMWVSAALAMFLKYGEIVLAVLTRKRGSDGTWQGGAMVYLRTRGGTLGRVAAALFCLLCVLCALTLGAPVQSNTAASAAFDTLGVPPVAVGGLLAALTALAVFGGFGKIASFCEKLIPLMSVLYLCLSLWAVVTHIESLPRALSWVVRDAFSFRAGGAGVLGFLSARAVRYGVTRGLLSHEAGAGTAPLAHVAAENTAASQGVLGMLEVGIDTFVFCTATALPLLIAYPDGLPALGGMVLVNAAFSLLVGRIAPLLLAVSVLLFAYATVLAWCHYGKCAVRYLTSSGTAQTGYLCLYVALVFFGALWKEGWLWSVTDLAISLLTMLHGACLVPLLPTVVAASREAGLFGGKRVLFRRRGERQAVKRRKKVLGQGGENGKRRSACGVTEGKARGVEHRARKTLTLSAVKSVAHDGEAHM
ncbi:MAG: amino acid carrier protein [Clostridia bacterium]|nr:amino acid carrier protein [Clostridia bacterium]